MERLPWVFGCGVAAFGQGAQVAGGGSRSCLPRVRRVGSTRLGSQSPSVRWRRRSMSVEASLPPGRGGRRRSWQYSGRSSSATRKRWPALGRSTSTSEAEGLAVQFQDIDVVGQAVEERASEAFLAECGGPFVERQVRGDDGGAQAPSAASTDRPSCRHTPWPAIKRHLAHTNLADRIRHRHTLAMQNINLPQLSDNLFWLVDSLCHRGPTIRFLESVRKV